jgi:hypothetical protein
VTTAQEQELHRLAEANGLAVSVTRSKSVGMDLVEIWLGDPQKDGRDAKTFYAFEHARQHLLAFETEKTLAARENFRVSGSQP